MRGTRGCSVPMLVPGLVSLLVLAALVVAAVLIVRALRRNGGLRLPQGGPAQPDPVQNALLILNERLARGEVEIDDYYARLSALKGHDPTPDQ